MKHVENYLPDHITNSLSPVEQMSVDEHLGKCKKCRDEREHLAKAIAQLQKDPFFAPDRSYFTTILPRVRERIADHETQPGWDKGLLGRIVFPIAFSAILLFILLRNPSEGTSSMVSQNALPPIVNELSPEELGQIESESLMHPSVLGSANELMLEETLASPQAVPFSLVQAALAEGELDDVVGDMMAQLSEAELDAVVQQLGERTVME